MTSGKKLIFNLNKIIIKIFAANKICFQIKEDKNNNNAKIS